MLSELHPKVTSLAAAQSASTDLAALDFLRSATLLGLLPPSPPLRSRPFLPSSNSDRWLRSLVWGQICVSHWGIFGGTRVGLFTVQDRSNAPESMDVVGMVGRVSEAVWSMGRDAVQGRPSRVPSSANSSIV